MSSNRAHGQFSCPVDGCSSILCSINGLVQHLINKHGFTARETWPIRDALKEKGDDLEKFKKDYAEICGGEG